MSIEDKQNYLKQEIIDRGINPEDFFDYWQTFDLELDDVTIEKLQEIVEAFLQQLPPKQEHQGGTLEDVEGQQSKGKQNQDDEDEFTDFQEAEPQQSKDIKETKNYYADFNWDFLNSKKQHHEPLPQTSLQFSPQRKNEKPLPTIKETPKTIVDKPRKLVSAKKRQQVQLKPKVERKIEQPMSKATPANLIEQIDEKYSQKNEVLADHGNPKEQKSMTVRDVLQSSKLGKMKCLKLQQNVLSHHTNVEIFLTNVEEVEEKNSNLLNKLIKSTVNVFTIKTIARNKNRSIGITWEVKRKTQDFEWLRNTLIRFYPGLVVPPLPSPSKSKQKIFGYQKKLEHFLIDCYRCPQLKNSKYYEVFLSYASQADFDGFIKNNASASKPKTLGHIINMTGMIDTLQSGNIEQYGVGLQNYLTKTSNHLKHVNQILNEINEAYDNISESYRELANVFMEMSDESHSFSDEKCYERLAATYKQIAILTGEHSSFCEGEKDFIDAFMKSHFSYEKLRLENMQNLIVKRNYFATQLGKKSKDDDGKSMFGKITGLFGDKSEYVDTPSANYETLYNQVGYYNNQLLQESIRCVQGMIESHINHFSGYGHSRIDNVDKMQKIWSNQLVELSKLGLSK